MQQLKIPRELRELKSHVIRVAYECGFYFVQNGPQPFRCQCSSYLEAQRTVYNIIGLGTNNHPAHTIAERFAVKYDSEARKQISKDPTAKRDHKVLDSLIGARNLLSIIYKVKQI